MLTELRIENFAIIEHLELNFLPGLIIFTGETGAGKSIIIDAVEMVLGGRAEATMIRSGSERAIIEATFTLPENLQPYVHEILKREELFDAANTIMLGREIRQNGRNAARVNGRSVNTAILIEIGQYLIDVHGQSEHLSLLHVNQHLGLLDRFANVADLVSTYQGIYLHLHQVRKELNELHQAESDAARRTDILKYQINEIESARLRVGEEEELRDERNRLANAEGLAALTQQALQTLEEGSGEVTSIMDLLGQVNHALESLTKLDPAQKATSDQAAEVLENLSDITRSLHLYQENIEFNPRRLDFVEERLNLLHNLLRKYGHSIQEVLDFARQAHAQLETITHAGERIAELEQKEQDLLAQLGVSGSQLSAMRRKAADSLCQAIEAELNDLNMSGAHFQVEFKRRTDPTGAILEDGQRVAFSPNGLDHVEFLVAPNPGEGLKPLVKIASGGETSRLMLALKHVLTRADQIPILIFDEIDQGIGGRIGTVVGQKLRGLAKSHQVLCITHLPQLAVYGEQHYRVEKVLEGGRTHTQVKIVEGEERLVELAQMMGEVSEGTRRSAQELLQIVTQSG